MANKTTKKPRLFLVVFIIFIMITSVLGYLSYYNSGGQDQANNAFNIDYNGFKFATLQDGRFVTNINNINFIFDNLPSNLEDINLPSFQITQNKVYLLYNATNLNPSNDYSIAKLSYTLQNLGIRPVLACINEENCPEQYPIKTCENEAFYFKLENTTNIYRDNNCIVVQGDNFDRDKIIDKINLKLIGVL